MKHKKIIIAAVILFIIASGLFVYQKVNSFSYIVEKQPIETWAWNPKSLIENKDDMIKNVRELHIESLYVYWDSEISTEEYAKLVLLLKQENCNVEFVLQDTKWLQYPPLIHTALQQILQYNERAQQNEQVQRVHISLPFSTETYEHAQTIIAEAKAYMERTNLQLIVDVTVPIANLKNENGTTLYEWLAKEKNEIVLIADNDNIQMELHPTLQHTVALQVDYSLQNKSDLKSLYKTVGKMKKVAEKQTNNHVDVAIAQYDTLALLLHDEKRSTSEIIQQTSVGVWMWNAWDIVNKPNEVMEYVNSFNIDTLYIYLEPTVEDIYYRQFARQMRAKGKDVEFLVGSGEQGVLATESELQVMFQRVDTYNAQSTVEEQIKTLHVDIEPYTNPAFTPQNKEMIEAWKQQIRYFREQTIQRGYKLVLDTGDWMEMVPNGEGGSMYEYQLLHCDSLILMSYHDTAEETLKRVKDELELSKRIGIYPELSYETQQLEEEAYTFYEEGLKKMYTAISDVQHVVQSEYNYVPKFSIHYYPTFVDMIKKYQSK